ncbi:IncF plasmid conjugative transfer pilus assembly protein TraK [Methylomonas albis]|nr:IncF plasmid conjugative transfer pilus assembly protein TraK [Methylomonas albis]
MGAYNGMPEFMAALEQVLALPQWRDYFAGFSCPYGFKSVEDYQRWLPAVGFVIKRLELIEKHALHADAEAFTSQATTSTKGKIVYVATADETPVTSYITPGDNQDIALSLTLIPKRTPAREIHLDLDKDSYQLLSQWQRTDTASRTSSQQEQAYIGQLKGLFRDLGLQKTPPAYSLREPQPHEQIHCLQDRLQIKTGQVLEGQDRLILVGLGEVLQVLLAVARTKKLAIEFLYAEPKQYTQRTSENIADRQMRHFSLTQNCQFRSVQGFAHEYEPNMKAAHVFLLGFESARLQNAIEQRGDFDQKRYRCHVVVGVPAFQAGWESNAIRPHLSLLEDLNITERSIAYCQANSIREAYLTLWELYKQLGDEHGCFFISPLGTKPHAIATALFLLETKGNDIPTSLYYDHPERVKNRSSEVAVWHHVQVTMNK